MAIERVWVELSRGCFVRADQIDQVSAVGLRQLKVRLVADPEPQVVLVDLPATACTPCDAEDPEADSPQLTVALAYGLVDAIAQAAEEETGQSVGLRVDDFGLGWHVRRFDAPEAGSGVSIWDLA